MAKAPDRDHGYERTLLLRFSLIGLAVTIAMAAVLGYYLQRQLVEGALSAAADIAVRQVNTAIRPIVSAEDMQAPFSVELNSALDEIVKRDLKGGGIVRIKIWNRDGTVVFSDNHTEIGSRDTGNAELAEALAGSTETELSDLSKSENAGERKWGKLLEVYVPLRTRDSQGFVGAYEIYQTTEALDQRISEIRRTIAVGVFGGFGVLYLALFGVVLGAANRLVEHSRENERLAEEITLAYDDTIEGWARALDLKDHETEGHSRRVTELAVEIAREMGMTEEELVDVRRGALLHDIGKMGIPDEILNKPGKLTDEEWEIMRAHPIYARDMLQGVGYLGRALDIPVHHHERWDGTGYPEGLAGEAIPLSARIFAIVDVWDALSSDRPYREAWPPERVLGHLEEGAETHFDPAALQAFLAVVRRRVADSATD